MTFPKPPSFKAAEVPTSAGNEPDPQMHTANGTLTPNETEFILDSCLLPMHRHDPNVLRFIASYVRCRSNTQAALEAGLPKHSGHHLRNKPDIHAAIQKITDKSVMKYGFDASEVIERTKEISSIDLAEFENPDGSYKMRLSEISPEARRAIKKLKLKNLYEKDPNGMSILVGHIIEIEVWDKMKAIELLGREKDIFKETRKVQHDVSTDMKSFLLESQKRADDRIAKLQDVTPRPQLTGETVINEDDLHSDG